MTKITKANIERRRIDKAMKTQKAEFEAMYALAKAYNALPAIVDDDYPEMRHRYESAMQAFIGAIRANGRIE